MPHILIVDDNELDRFLLAKLVAKYAGCPCLFATNGHDAVEQVKNDTGNQIAAVLLDQQMPLMDGRMTLPKLLELRPEMQVIAVTANHSAQDAVDMIKQGAADYLSKPIAPDLFSNALSKALRIHNLREEIEALRMKSENAMQFAGLVGQSPAMHTCVKLAKRAAASDITVFITGESGVGKEMLARAIHTGGSRANKPFIAVNCGALPKDLVESALFGHKKGSFTGAIADAPGKFMEANGGTLFLDEIGELPLETQVKLLRALQEREIEPVGSGKSVPVNIRVIAATNRNAQHAVQRGHMREDLFYRLNVFPIHMPPLRQRPDDLLPLSQHFLERYAEQENKRVKRFDDQALQWIKSYGWPGNVRELENTVYRAVLLCDGAAVRREHLLKDDNAEPDAPQTPSANPSPARQLDLLDASGRFKSMAAIRAEIERAALAFHADNLPLAARQLGIGVSTLYRHRQTKT